MGFVLLGVLLVVLRLGGWVQFHKDDLWAWMIVLSPFLGAVLWWMWADGTGYTKKKAMQAMAARQAARREQQMVNLGQSKAGGKHRR